MLNGIHIAQTGMSASKHSVDNVTNNISNQNTEGYKKRVSSQEELSHVDGSQVGRGTKLENIARVTDIYMERNIQDKTSSKEYLETKATVQTSLNQLLSETEFSGLSSDMQTLFNNLEEMRMSPNNPIYVEELKRTGETLTTKINETKSELNLLEKDTTTLLKNQLMDVNKITEQIALVNKELENNPTASNGLLDKRDQLEKDLSQYIKIDVSKSFGEQYSIKTDNKHLVFGTTSHDLNLEQTKQSQSLTFNDNNGNNSLTGTETFSLGDSIKVVIDNQEEINITYGEAFSNIDIDGNGSLDSGTVNENNFNRVLANKINSASNNVNAYNGTYQLDSNNNKITNDSGDSFLIIENDKFNSKVDIYFNDSSLNSVSKIEENTSLTKDNGIDSKLNLLDSEIELKQGSLKALIENIDINSYSNEIKSLNAKIDDLSNNLNNLTKSYIEDSGVYTFGEEDSITSSSLIPKTNIQLFTKNEMGELSFNSTQVNNLTQSDLDYLTQLQWKEDISFDFTGEESSINDFINNVRVNVASNLESTVNILENTNNILTTLENNHEAMTKVDIDEQMINLLKFQASYEANAKIITTYDEMLKTILAI